MIEVGMSEHMRGDRPSHELSLEPASTPVQTGVDHDVIEQVDIERSTRSSTR
jgi:hypothetical protein